MIFYFLKYIVYIKNHKSKIKNHKSKIKNHKSKIKNQKLDNVSILHSFSLLNRANCVYFYSVTGSVTDSVTD